MKKSSKKFIFYLAFLLILGVLSLSSCTSNKLSGDFNEDDVKKAAENVILLINSEDTEKFRELSNARLNEALTDDVMSQIYTAVREAGPFEQIDSMTVVGTTVKSTNEDFAVAVAVAKYTNKTFTYTISFDTQMKLAGLYYK